MPLHSRSSVSSPGIAAGHAPLVPVLSLVLGVSFAGPPLAHETLHGAVARPPLRRVVG
jgi:hypothetical protein